MYDLILNDLHSTEHILNDLHWSEYTMHMLMYSIYIRKIQNFPTSFSPESAP